jgi:hypothetical protein
LLLAVFFPEAKTIEKIGIIKIEKIAIAIIISTIEKPDSSLLIKIFLNLSI